MSAERLLGNLDPQWRDALASEFDQSYFRRLCSFVERERSAGTILPPERDVFAALNLTPPGRIRVAIVGQDPYHDIGQAHGLAFSVLPGCTIPPSLRNIFKELSTDIPGFSIPDHGCLTAWAHQGVLLLNSVLTVRAHAANSHRGKGWEQYTDAILRTVSGQDSPVVFVLWGAHAQKKASLIDLSRHHVLESAHPSPLSAHRGFFGSRPFSTTNRLLESSGLAQIDWRL